MLLWLTNFLQTVFDRLYVLTGTECPDFQTLVGWLLLIPAFWLIIALVSYHMRFGGRRY